MHSSLFAAVEKETVRAFAVNGRQFNKVSNLVNEYIRQVINRQQLELCELGFALRNGTSLVFRESAAYTLQL